MSWEALPAPYFPVKDAFGVAGYEMKLNVDRQATYYILKVIIPLCLIVIMSWLPRWIDPEQSLSRSGEKPQRRGGTAAGVEISNIRQNQWQVCITDAKPLSQFSKVQIHRGSGYVDSASDVQRT